MNTTKQNKFKVGDRVRVLPRKDVDRYNYPKFVDSMLEHVGKVYTVKSLTTDIRGTTYNLIFNDWRWNEDWLELVEDKTIDKPKKKVIYLVPRKLDLSEVRFEHYNRLVATRDTIIITDLINDYHYSAKDYALLLVEED